MAVLGNTKITNITLLDGVIGDLNPVNTDVYNLGTSSLRWNNLYAKAIYGTTQAQTDNSTAMATTAYVRAAINALDVAAITGSASKTLTSISETDGKISATYSDIAINESQVTWTNNTLYTIGDDVYIGDVNVAGHLGVKGKNGNTGIIFTTYNQSTNTTGGQITWNGSKFVLTGTAPTLGTSTIGSARQLIYLNAGVPTNGNYVVSHLGNAGKSNMNDVGRLHASMGMTNLTDPGNTVDNPGNAVGWHHYIDINYTDDPNGSNSWVTQFANKAGTTDLWMRSRSGSTITNGTAWVAPWTRILTETNISQALNANNSGLNLLPQSQDLQGWTGTENRTDTPFSWCYSHSAAKGSNNYADIAQNNVIAAEPDTWYTLSYWAKASAATAINNYFYNGSTVSQGYNSSGATTTATDGSIAQQLTTTWQHYWVTWKTRSDVTGNKHLILARVQTDATVYIALPKLEKGRVATGWLPNPGDAYHIYGRTGNTNLIYNGGGGTAADQSLILHGNSTTGSSGIAFVSGKGNTAINYPSDRAFIQFHPYGVTTYTAEGTAPTLATSGEAATLVIGVGNDTTDTIHLQTPGRTGLYHQVGANYYTIPDTNNTTGTVGSSSLPVYVNAGVITAVIAKDTCNAFINALDTGSSALTANDYVITQYVGGGTTTKTYHRRPASAVVNKTLVDAALGTSNTANFYRGDKNWSNTLKQTANAALGVDSSTLKIGTARKDLNFDITNGTGAGVNDGYAGGITWGSGTSAYAGIYYQTSGNYGSRLIFGTTGSYANGAYARMIIQSNGNVGIGTLSPDTLLTINGNAKATKFIGALEGNATSATTATTATTATNLSAKPSLAASGNNITVTAGGKTSDAFTVPYATSAGSVTWANVSGKPIEFGTHSGALNTNGWKTMGARTSGAKIYIAYNNNPASWNSATYSSSIVFGCQDTKGLLDIGHAQPIVTFGGSSTGNSTDNDPKWYFKLSGTSGKTYTFPSDTKTLAAADGSNASGTGWAISITGNAATASKISAALVQTKKIYLLGTETALSSTAANVSLTGDSGVYLTTTPGELSAYRHSWHFGTTERAYSAWNDVDECIDFIFV